jgi:hypothetical protein
MSKNTWDYIDRFKNDPCKCSLCRKIQRVVIERYGDQLFVGISQQYHNKNRGKKGVA